MRIEGFGSMPAQTGQPGMNQETDALSRNLQNQIANAQKKLQELSSNEALTMEEKMKRRQEIQKEISDLTNQLRQHQMELKRERQRERETSSDAAAKNQQNGQNTPASAQAGMSQASMQAMISADCAVSQARVQGSVATRAEGQANVIKSEIKQDQARGVNTQSKEDELSKMEQTAASATASQISILGKANNVLSESSKHNDDEQNTDKSETSESLEQTENTSNADRQKASEDSSKSEDSKHASDQTEDEPRAYYTPVDIRL